MTDVPEQEVIQSGDTEITEDEIERQLKELVEDWMTNPNCTTVGYPKAGSRMGMERFIILTDHMNLRSLVVQVNIGGLTVVDGLPVRGNVLSVKCLDYRNETVTATCIINDNEGVHDVNESIHLEGEIETTSSYYEDDDTVDAARNADRIWRTGGAVTYNPFAHELEGADMDQTDWSRMIVSLKTGVPDAQLQAASTEQLKERFEAVTDIRAKIMRTFEERMRTLNSPSASGNSD